MKFNKLLILLLILVFSSKSFADSSDYVVGLNAYNDGFYDVAKMSLDDYLKTGKKKANIIYSKYLLYQIYFSDKEYEKSEKLFLEIKDINDKRFNKSIIRRDKVRYYVKTDCSNAAKIVKKYPEISSASLYAISECTFDESIYKSYLIKGTDNSIRIRAMVKSKDFPKSVSKLFKKIDSNNFNESQNKYFGAYFYKYEDFDSFWRIYQQYKDSDMVNYALNRLWSLKKDKSFIKSFEYNKQYKISSNNSCRAITLYDKSKTDFSCDLIEKCYVEKNENYHKSMLACLLKSNSTEKIKLFIETVEDKNFKYVCEYSEYLVANGYYDNQGVHRFSKCSQVNNIADILLDKNKPESVLKLFSGKSSDNAYYYISLAYQKKGELEKAKLFKDKITDAAFKKSLSGI